MPCLLRYLLSHNYCGEHPACFKTDTKNYEKEGTIHAGFLKKLRLFVYNVFCMIVSVGKERRMKGYLFIRETSCKWGISERCVNQYAAQGRIPGAERFGRSWAIPDDAVKPTDPRKKTPAIPDTNRKAK